MTDYQYQEWPKWLYGPNGEGKVFQSEEDVPEGWVDHPSKLGAEPAAEAPKRGRPKKAPEDSTPIEDFLAEAPVEPSEF